MAKLPDGLRPKAKPRSAMTAAALSLLFPGLGFIHASAWRLAVYYLAGYLGIGLVLGVVGASEVLFSFYGFFTFTVAALLFEILYRLFAAVMSYRYLRRLDPNPPSLTYGWPPYVMFVVAAVGLKVAIGQIPQPVAAYSLSNSSMIPTIHNGDSFAATAGPPPDIKRGDVVVFAVPEQHDPKDFTRRVIGLPGDEITLEAGEVLLNGARLTRRRTGQVTFTRRAGGNSTPQRVSVFEEELPSGRRYGVAQMPGESADAPKEPESVMVPDGHVFLLGDNRDFSTDSRAFGPIPVESIRGRALFIYWADAQERIGRRLDQ